MRGLNEQSVYVQCNVAVFHSVFFLYQRSANFPEAPEPLHSSPSATHLTSERGKRCGIQQGV